MFLCGNIITAQYLSKDFNDLSLTSGGWTTQIIIDTTNWFVDSFLEEMILQNVLIITAEMFLQILG